MYLDEDGGVGSVEDDVRFGMDVVYRDDRGWKRVGVEYGFDFGQIVGIVFIYIYYQRY